jgi:hypothetical protein
MDWPKAWQSADRLALLSGSPVNCLLLEEEPDSSFKSAAEKSGIHLLGPQQQEVQWRALKDVDWTTKSQAIGVKDGVWPHLGFRGGGDNADSGPTGAPWLDSNAWVLQYARNMAPSKEIWLRAETPDKKDMPKFDAYRLALVEAEVFGAKRPIWLSPDHASAIAAGTSPMKENWERLIADMKWFQERRPWAGWQTVALLLVISDFKGPNEYAGTEFMNLANRRNLQFEAADPKRFTAAQLDKRIAALYIGAEPLQPTTLAALQAFAERGGLVIGMKAPLAKLRGLRPHTETNERFDMFACGKGRVAVAKAEWDDPFVLAQDTHLLMSRRHDQVRLFNGGSLIWRETQSADGRSRLVHILNYAGGWPAGRVSLQCAHPIKSARIHSLGNANPQQLEIFRNSAQEELHLPPFTIYAAVELEISAT